MRTTRNWMGAIDGHRSLSQFSIPGTHNSGAMHEPLRSTSQCQDLTIAEQLAAGVRFLDVRCRHIKDSFAIYHGPISQHLTFAEVIAVCCGFLADHPTECVVMSVNEESKPSRSTRPFEDTFDSYVAESRQLWELGSAIPTLDQARAKIVLLRRFASSGPARGIDASQWPVNSTFAIDAAAKLRVQDQYVVPDNRAKLAAIENLYSEAASARDDILYLNFTSGYRPATLGLPDIRPVSDAINPAVFNYFTANKRGRYGVSVMDFADKATCELIIATNYD